MTVWIALAAIAAATGAWALAGAALAVALARAWGLRGGRLAALAAALWGGALAVSALAPDSAGARLIGWPPQVLALVGVTWAALGGYGALVGAARRRAGTGAGGGWVARAPAAGAPPGDGPGNGAIAARDRDRRRGSPSSGAESSLPPSSPVDPAGPLTEAELDRYARHIVLRELGGPGQRRLRAARVLVVGAGGLGAPVLMYLAAAGVGRITVADDDTVGLSNLQRQVIFSTADIGRPKVRAAAAALAALNPHVAVTPLARRVTADDAALVADHDLVLDGTDSFAARAAVNAACVAARVPLIAGAIAQWEGQVTLYDPARGGPCLACLFPVPPAPGLAPSCAEAGVVGALPGVIGSVMALEAVKLIAGLPDAGAAAGLRGRMILWDGLWGETRRVTTARRADCPVCGDLAA